MTSPLAWTLSIKMWTFGTYVGGGVRTHPAHPLWIRACNYAGLPAKLLLWERMWKGKKDRREDIPDSIDATLEQIDKDAYVNIYTILQILITIPISSASCERSISTLRNLKTYLRKYTMVQDRLNGLALMHAHREIELDLEKIIDLFANLHPRRMRMENILNE